MKKKQKLSLSKPWIREDDGWILELGSSDVRELILNLLMLEYELIDLLELHQGSDRMVLRYGQEFLDGHVNSEGDFTFAPNNIEFLLSTLLQYARDGVAPAPHIDVELQWPKGDAFDLSIWFRDSTPPMSADEVKKEFGF